MGNERSGKQVSEKTYLPKTDTKPGRKNNNYRRVRGETLRRRKLTAREEEVLKLLAKGLTSKQIGTAIFIEETTVETHRKNLFQKFGAKNIAELIKKASKLYWLE